MITSCSFFVTRQTSFWEANVRTQALKSGKTSPKFQKKGSITSQMILFITVRTRSLGPGNIFSSVCQEFCTRGGCLSACWDTPPGSRPLQTRHLPGPGIPPPGADTPGPGTPRSRPLWTRHPPPCTVHAGRYGQQAGGMHPTGVQYCFNINWKMNGPIWTI